MEETTEHIETVSAKEEDVTGQQNKHSVFTTSCKRLMTCLLKDLKQVITKYMTLPLFVQLKEP